MSSGADVGLEETFPCSENEVSKMLAELCMATPAGMQVFVLLGAQAQLVFRLRGDMIHAGFAPTTSSAEFLVAKSFQVTGGIQNYLARFFKRILR